MQTLKNLFGPEKFNDFTIKEFWNWFEDHEQQFSQAIRDRTDVETMFFDQLSTNLGRLREGIFFLAGELDDNKVELILTPDGNIINVEFIERLVQSAPTLSGWAFTAFKRAQSIENVSVKYGDYFFEQDQLFFYSNDNDQYPDLIDLTIVHKLFNEENRRIIENGTYLFLDMYIGELNCISIIDNLRFCSIEEAEETLVPIGKLDAFLKWRNKEFVEQYEDVLRNSEEDQHALFEGNTNDGMPLIAVMNTDVLQWENKASHPWILKIIITYDGSETNGFPTPETNKALDEQEEGLVELLKESDGYINVGRETGKNQRQIYFACKGFRKASRTISDLIANHMIDSIKFELYKDKYWRTFERFKPV